MWYYIDDNQQKQGPFKPRKLQKWYTRGLLPPTLLLSRDLDAPINTWMKLQDLDQNLFERNVNETHVDVEDDPTRSLRAQILTTQCEIALTRLQNDALNTVATSLATENDCLRDEKLLSFVSFLKSASRRNAGGNGSAK